MFATEPNQFSAAASSQWAAQLQLVSALNKTTLDGLTRLAELNKRTVQEAMSNSTAALSQLRSQEQPSSMYYPAQSAIDSARHYGQQAADIYKNLGAEYLRLMQESMALAGGGLGAFPKP